MLSGDAIAQCTLSRTAICPNTTRWPSSHSHLSHVRKNWHPFVSLPELACHTTGQQATLSRAGLAQHTPLRGPWARVLRLVCELLSIDAHTARAVAFDKVATLQHKSLDNAMKIVAFITDLRPISPEKVGSASQSIPYAWVGEARKDGIPTPQYTAVGNSPRSLELYPRRARA